MRKVLLLLLLSVSFLLGQNYSTSFKSGEWIRSWLLCGPIELNSTPNTTVDYRHITGFETDFLKAHGGEANLKVKPGQVENIGDVTIKWKAYSSKDSIIDLDKALSNKAEVVAYGYCEIEAEKDTLVIFSFGSNDGARVWLNGEQIFDYYEPRGVTPDDDQIPVVLRKGRNTLLIKVEERAGSWGFCVRFRSVDILSFLTKTQPFSVINHQESKALLRCVFPQSVLNIIFDKVKIRLFSKEDKPRLLWEADWKKKQNMLVYPEFKDFSKFTLHIESILTNGKKWQTELPVAIGKWQENVLFEKGKSDYKIVIAANASKSEKWAAKELQHWIKETGGAELAIVDDAVKQSGKEIIIGYNTHSAALLKNDIKKPKEMDESFTYKNINSNIVIYGGALRGTMYGVFTFLEQELGCRWYTPTVTVIPKKDRYTFNYLYHHEAPAIRVRNDFYYEAFNPVWAARNKINGAMGYREQPGDVEAYWSVHTFNRLMPPDEFFAQHPEYFSLIDGKRTADHSQLCLTNPEVLKTITERLRKVMQENPQYLIYSVSQNDWRNPCQCEKCQAIVQKEQSESGVMIWFVNQVADNIKKEFPNKYIGTLAYQYTRKSPKHISPKENVVVRFCSIECCFAHDFTSCPENQSFLNDLQQWAQISPHLYIWDYVVNFSHYIMPYPNFRVLKNNIRTFRDNKAIGIMEQAAYQSRGGEFAELRAYLLSKLLWNPEINTDEVIDDFMYGYYGRSGQYIREYFDYLHNQLTPDTHIHLGLKPVDPLFSDKFVRESEKIFDKAEKNADNEVILKRVEVARLPIMYLKCKRLPLEARHDGTYERFNKIVKREGITHYAEAGKPHRERFEKNVENAR